jgi:hypothetical protein
MLQSPFQSPKKTAVTGRLNTLFKPEVKTVQNPKREQQRTSHQEAPQALCKASEDMCNPCRKAGKTNESSHYFALTIGCANSQLMPSW